MGRKLPGGRATQEDQHKTSTRPAQDQYVTWLRAEGKFGGQKGSEARGGAGKGGGHTTPRGRGNSLETGMEMWERRRLREAEQKGEDLGTGMKTNWKTVTSRLAASI